MDHVRSRSMHRRGGAAYVTVLVVLLIFTTLSVAYMSAATLGLQKSSNLAHMQEAQFAAESGLSFMLLIFEEVELPPNTTESDLMANLQTSLTTKLARTANLAGAYPTASDTDATITVPQVQLPYGSFSCQIALSQVEGSTACTLTVTGTAGQVSRRVAMDFLLAPRRAVVFDYGVASRGKISISSNGAVTGGTVPGEATILSTKSDAPAIEVTGSGTVGGSLNVTGQSETFVELGNGGISVAGESDPDTIIANHVGFGVEAPIFPELDTAPIVAFAVNEFNSETTWTGADLDNVRIAAGTDPHFSSDTVINGVMYIESPNVVTFSGGVTINGIIVTEKDTSQDVDDCQIDFRGNVSVPGVDALPDSDQFAAIKEHRGTAILAPGFGLNFRGNTGTINGVIAADQLDFSGNSHVTGDLYGSVLGLQDFDLSITGSAAIRINRMQPDLLPAGFTPPLGLDVVGGSYTEPIGN